MTNRPPIFDPARDLPEGLGDLAARLRLRRGWIVAFGALNALLGLVALVLTETATIASVVIIGLFMIVVGVVEIGVGLRTRAWGRMLLWETAGFFYIVAGLVAVLQPIEASVWITLLLGAGMLATGIVRMVMGVRMRAARTRPGVIVAGAVTALLGLLIVGAWPNSSVFVLGTFLAIDLLIYGLTWIRFGLRLRVA